VNRVDIARALKVPLKRAIAGAKGVTARGDAFVSPLALVRGRGRIELLSGARIDRHACATTEPGGRILLAERAHVKRGTILEAGWGSICIGQDSTISYSTIVYGYGGVTIGNRVLIANHVLLTTADHSYEGRRPVCLQPMRYTPIVIEDDVWVGAGAAILMGVRIGQGAIVGAHALVRQDVPPYAVVGGSPARLLRMREE
jgi:acetyltransferase-like isoleucine patch superfamily enzyme